jgi:membrane protein
VEGDREPDQGGGLRRLRRLAGATVTGVENYFFDRGSQFAAAISYRAIFSVIPLLTFAVTVIGVVLRDDSRRDALITDLVDRFSFSEQTRADLEKILTSIPSPWSVLGIVSIVAVLWSASGVMSSVRIGLTVAAGGMRTRSFARSKLFDFLLVFLLTVLVLAAAALNVMTRAVARWSDEVADKLDAGALGALFNGVVSGLVAPMLLMFCACAFLYRVIPPIRAPWRCVLVGAAFAALALQLVQLGMAWYLSGPAELDAVYGSLGAALAFLLAVYVSATAFLICGELVFAWSGRLPPDQDEGLFVRVRELVAGPYASGSASRTENGSRQSSREAPSIVRRHS